VFNSYQKLLQNLSTQEALPLLTKIQRGIEKEGLRVTPQANIAQTKHSKFLGSPLTHPSITTDYSEALLEFITPVSSRISDSIDYLSNLHIYTSRNIAGEYIWPASMPCTLEGEESIPIAQYGNSNIGRMKHVYRQGLAVRYGKTMQSIAGIHYNFSMPDEFWPLLQQLNTQELSDQELTAQKSSLQDFKSARYLGLIRNFQRHSWLLTYLFGASPVLDKSFFNSPFMASQQEILQPKGNNTLGLPYATSLRMSDLGYQSKAQASLDINYNHLDEYLDNLQVAMQTPYDDYEKLGVQVDGEYRQLNANILQVENEYYSGIRPKRVPAPGETSSEALRKEGIEYVEVRTLDINPFLSVGLDEEQVRVLDSFLLYCLLSDSAEISSEENCEVQHNQKKVILEGRKPGLMLQQGGREISFADKAKALLNKLSGTADLLDSAHLVSGHSNTLYSEALAQQLVKIEHPEQTPSGMIMADMVKGFGFSDLMLKQAKRQQQYFLTQPLSYEVEKELQQQALISLQQQKDIEAQETDCQTTKSFENFLQAIQLMPESDVEQLKVVGGN